VTDAAGLEQRLARCFQAVFPELPPEEIPRATPAAVASWDSVAALTLMAAVDEEFGVATGFDEIQDLQSFALLVDYLREKSVT